MAVADDPTRSGLSRRNALRLLAASTTTVAAGSMIVSRPAFAANGSVDCGFVFGNTPTVRLQIRNRAGSRTDRLSISVGNTNGRCECSQGGRPSSTRFAFYVSIPGLGSGGTGWIGSDDASVSSPDVLWGDGGGRVTVSVGVEVTCPGTGDDVVQCWYGTTDIRVEPADWNSSPSFSLDVNSSSNNPVGIPACGSRFNSSALRAGPSLNLVAGILPDTDPSILDEQVLDERTVDLGEIDPPEAPTSSSTTSTSSSTTSTTNPSTTPTTSSSTSTTSSTTSSSSTTTTSATPPPDGG